jgi:hypothetical protein
MTEPYADSTEHLLDELTRIDLLIRRALLLNGRSMAAAPPQEFQGVVVAQSEIEVLLSHQQILGQHWQHEPTVAPNLAAIDEKLEAKRRLIDQRRERTHVAKRPLALPRLAQMFELAQAEVDLLLVALAPELETRYETLYAYLQIDALRKRPSADLAMNLIAGPSAKSCTCAASWRPTGGFCATASLS